MKKLGNKLYDDNFIRRKTVSRVNAKPTSRFQPDDAEIRRFARRYCEGEDDFFRPLYDACKHAVLRIAFHFAGDGESAKDLSQEIWLKIWKHVCSFRGEAKMMSWVYRVAFTTYLDKKKSLFSLSNRSFIANELKKIERRPFESEPFSTGARGADAFAEAASDAALAQEALKRLTKAERAVFVAKHFHELTFKEIAAELGVTEGTIKTLHFRAVKKLQAALAAHYPEFGEKTRP